MPGKLLPCPFCGGAAQIGRIGNGRQSCIVSCEDCGVTLESNENGFGDAWNRRAKTAEAVDTAHNIRVMPLPSIEEVLSQSGNMHGVLSVNERDAVIRAYHIIAQQQHNT